MGDVSTATLAQSLRSDETLGRLLALHMIFLALLLAGDVLPTALHRLMEVAVTGTTILLLLVVVGQLVGRYHGSDPGGGDA